MTRDGNQQVAEPWRGLWTAQPGAGEMASLPDLFRANVTRRPDAPFLHYFGATLSYAQCEARVDALACHLAAIGVCAGDRVAMVLQNVPDLAVVTLAAWRIGAALMPLNPMYKARELAKLFIDAAPSVCVCHPAHAAIVRAAIGEAGIRCAVLVSEPTALACEPDPRVLPPHEPADGVACLDAICGAERASSTPYVTAGADALALLLYTSGTTGLPKGAMLSHRNLAASAHTAARWFGWSDETRVLGMAPLFHITGFVLHLAAAIVSGGSLILGYRFHSGVMLDLMRAYRPTYAIAPITAYLALQSDPAATPDHFASFEVLCTGGAPAPPAVVDSFEQAFGARLVNGYGMTEVAGASHCGPIGRGAPVDVETGALSVGTPMFGFEAKIVDEGGQPVPPGTVGDLIVRGEQVMQGYWRRPEESAAALNWGWLRTGDVAKMDVDGWFYLIDRKKDMIIASGFKVWPREVEDVLYTHPAVLEAAVVGVADAYRGETVKAVVALRPGTTASETALVAHCRDRLAAYKVPRVCEIVSELPKTLTGKIIRAQLRDTRA